MWVVEGRQTQGETDERTKSFFSILTKKKGVTDKSDCKTGSGLGSVFKSLWKRVTHDKKTKPSLPPLSLSLERSITLRPCSEFLSTNTGILPVAETNL